MHSQVTLFIANLRSANASVVLLLPSHGTDGASSLAPAVGVFDVREQRAASNTHPV